MLKPIAQKIYKAACTLEREAAHQGVLRAVQEFIDKENLPAKNWPRYVKNELLKQIKFTGWDRRRNFADFPPIVAQLSWEFDSEPEVLEMSTDLSNFETGTQKNLLSRIDALQKGVETSVPQDRERHQYQESLLRNKPPEDLINDQPVILYEVGLNKYRIREGWHRVMQLALEARRRGLKRFRCRAYVGRKGTFFDRLSYYARELYKYITNTPTPVNSLNRLNRQKMPYRDLLKNLDSERERLMAPDHTP